MVFLGDGSYLRCQLRIKGITEIAVNKANTRIIGFVGRLTFNLAPKGANAIIAKPEGIASLQFIIFFSPKVKAGTDVFATFSSIPSGIACVFKSIPSQKRMGINSGAPPLPNIENTNAITKKRAGIK